MRLHILMRTISDRAKRLSFSPDLYPELKKKTFLKRATAAHVDRKSFFFFSFTDNSALKHQNKTNSAVACT